VSDNENSAVKVFPEGYATLGLTIITLRVESLWRKVATELKLYELPLVGVGEKKSNEVGLQLPLLVFIAIYYGRNPGRNPGQAPLRS
jgi:hypothetical protein